MPTVQAFIDKYNGQQVKSPHGITGQCVSIPSQFAAENGWPELWGPGDDTAYHTWLNGVQGYTKIANITGPSGNYPLAGDFVFFGTGFGGGAGHTGLVQHADTASVTLFEQNDPYNSPAHLKTYSYYNLLGWFHYPLVIATVTYNVNRVVNVRTAPRVTAPVVAQLHIGTVETTGVVYGDVGTVGNKVSNQWGVTLNGHYFCLAATL